MAHELWTSTLTGHRRRGTRLAEIRALFEDGISAGAILELLKSCPADAPAEEMSRLLASHEFDAAGVKESPNTPLAQFVRREDLEHGLVRDHSRPLTTDWLIADSTPLADVLKVLRDKAEVFVLIGPEVCGIVTRADVNKPPVRLYLFGLISLLEMHLTYWIKEVYDGDSWKSALSPQRVSNAQRIQKRLREKREDLELRTCLQLADKCELVLASADACSILGIRDVHQTRELLESAVDLRHKLAHSDDDLTVGSSWKRISDVVSEIERLLHQSDRVAEEKASVGRSDLGHSDGN
jgi:predicted nucleotidyltransferase